MVKITGQQAAEVSRVFVCSPASSFVQEKLDAIQVVENALWGGCPLAILWKVPVDLIQPALLVEARHLGDLLVVHAGDGIAQRVLKGAL